MVYKANCSTWAGSERRKRIHVFQKVQAIVFVVDIAAYDQQFFENETTNRSAEYLTLFEFVIKISRWFTNTHFILLFTKMDKPEGKTKKFPVTINKYFLDFRGDGRSIEDIKAYIKQCYLDLCPEMPNRYLEVMFTIFSTGYAEAAWMALNTLTRFLSGV